MSKPLSSRDVNASTSTAPSASTGKDLKKSKSMEYHRQMLQNKMASEESKQTYISPSDTIMSPCTAKLSAMRNKQYMKAKPQSLFSKLRSKNSDSNAEKPTSFASSARFPASTSGASKSETVAAADAEPVASKAKEQVDPPSVR